jgi:hypothetical protein
LLSGGAAAGDGATSPFLDVDYLDLIVVGVGDIQLAILPSDAQRML